jgi:hypothetical protein
MLTLRTLLLLLLNTLLLLLCYYYHNYYSFPSTNWFNLWTRNTRWQNCLFTLTIKIDLADCNTMFLYYKSSTNSVTRCFVRSFEWVCAFQLYFHFRISLLKLIDHINRMDYKRKVSQVFNDSPQGSRLRRLPKQRRWNYIETDISECKTANKKKKKKKKKMMMMMMMMFLALFINYTRTFCASSQTFLPSFILTRIPSASNFEDNSHPQSFSLLFMKDVSALLCRYLVTPRSKNTQESFYCVHIIITPVVPQLLPAQIDCSTLFSSRQTVLIIYIYVTSRQNSIHMQWKDFRFFLTNALMIRIHWIFTNVPLCWHILSEVTVNLRGLCFYVWAVACRILSQIIT